MCEHGPIEYAAAGDLTLPGEIPGLLQRGSPVVPAGEDPTKFPTMNGIAARGASVDGAMYYVLWDKPCGRAERLDRVHMALLALDMTDRSGRVHAAWWVARKVGGRLHEALDAVDGSALVVWLAVSGEDMTDEQIATLRDLVLRLWRGSDDA